MTKTRTLPNEANRLLFELKPIPGKYPTKVEASTEKELVGALKEVLKLEDKAAKAAAHLLLQEGSIEMPTWQAKAVAKVSVSYEPLKPTKPKRVKKRPQEEGQSESGVALSQVAVPERPTASTAPEDDPIDLFTS